MHEIKKTETLAQDIQRITLTAPKIARKRKPGQFILLRIDEKGERIPLTIYDSDPEAGTITIVVQAIGKTTNELNSLPAGASIRDVAGPLGQASHIEKFGTVAVIGGGVGSAVAYPTAKALKEAGNHVVVIHGSRNKDLVILEEELGAIADEFYLCTDDGSAGFHGFVTQKLQQLLDEGRQIDMVLTIGPVVMMRAVVGVTKPNDIPTVVSLNPIMVDGTGMCGGCRVSVGGKSFFACVDGPEFDGLQVDFDQLIKRNRAYHDFETKKLKQHKCRLDKVME